MKLDFNKEYSFKPPASDELLGGIVYTGKPYDYARFFYSLDYSAIFFRNSQLDTLEKRAAVPRRLLQRKKQFDPVEDKHRRIYLMRTSRFLISAREYQTCDLEDCEPCISWRKIPDTAINGHSWRSIGEFV